MLDCNKKKKDLKNRESRKRKASADDQTDQQEVEHCKLLAINWFKKNIFKPIQEIKVSDIKTTYNEIQLSLECPLCHGKFRCHKFKNQTEQGWFLSNLYKHVKSQHLENKETTLIQIPISSFFTDHTRPGPSSGGQVQIVATSDINDVVHTQEIEEICYVDDQLNGNNLSYN